MVFPMSSSTLGIDFGTTRTVVAACDRGNYPVISFNGGNGEVLEWYPSVIAVRGSELKCGLDAVAADSSWHVVRSFKRMLGTGSGTIVLGDKSWSVLELMTVFLAGLRRDLIERSNWEGAEDGPIQAMIAVPAHAHSAQRFLTLAAFRAAGFEVAGVLNEPSAAGFEYAHRHRNTLTSRRERVAVYDLGGGTFDASLVQMSGKSHDVTATAGIGELGGDDFDAVLADMALAAYGHGHADLTDAVRQRLLDHCRDLKERLNPSSRKITVEIGACFDLVHFEKTVAIPCADYYLACAPLIAQTISALEKLLPAEDELAGIYVVGGASALPAIARALRDKFGRRVHRSPYPSAAAAIGLAIAMDETAGFQLHDRFSRVFGVFRETRSGVDISFDPIFTSTAELPRAQELTVSERTYRAAHNIGYYRYIECGSLDPSGVPHGDIKPFAELIFPFESSLRGTDQDLSTVKVARTIKPGPKVRERYAIDAAGLVELTITDLDSGYERRVRLTSDR